MSNITAFTVLVIILCCIQPVQAQEGRAYAFSLNPQFGIVSGQAEEIVYPPPAAYSGTKKYSQLLWDMKPVFYYGLLLDFSQINPRDKWGFFSNFSLKQGIPGKSGYIEDRDWLSEENSDLTHYSKHDNHTRELFFLDFSAGLSFPFFRTLLLKTFVNVSFMRFSFFGMNGYGYYIWYDPPHRDYRGKVISYTQEWLIAAPGVSIGYFFLNRFFAELSILASPLVLCTDLDEHKGRDIQFRDHMHGGILFEPGFQLSYEIGKWLDVSWDFSWRYISGTKGDIYSRSPIGKGTYNQEGKAGAGLSIINTGLSVKIKL